MTLNEFEKGKSFQLPQPSQSFIEKYVEEYNKGNVITDVLVEYENSKTFMEYEIGDYLKFPDLKVNPKDNTITIKKIKDNYTREDLYMLSAFIVHEIARNRGNASWNMFTTPKMIVDEWIKDNI